MSDHTFCRLLLKETRRTLTGEQRKRLVGSWSYNYAGQRDGVVAHDPRYQRATAPTLPFCDLVEMSFGCLSCTMVIRVQ